MGELSINDIKRKIKLPKTRNNYLAEFFGVLTGDGYINKYRKYDYVIEIAGNKISDSNYLQNYLSNLIKKLFNLNPNYIERNDQNSAYLRILSKLIFNYLIKKGFKKGKKGKIKIPNWIKKDKNFMKFFIKGVFDTDGCISLKNKEGKKYPVISITSKSEKLLYSIKKYLNSIKLNSSITKQIDKTRNYNKDVIRYKLEINGYKNLTNWFTIIGSSNKRNILKFNEAKKLLNSKTKV
jgi:hypothetical protein